MDIPSGNFPVLIDISILESVNIIAANICALKCAVPLISPNGISEYPSGIDDSPVISAIIHCVKYELFDRIPFR